MQDPSNDAHNQPTYAKRARTTLLCPYDQCSHNLDTLDDVITHLKAEHPAECIFCKEHHFYQDLVIHCIAHEELSLEYIHHFINTHDNTLSFLELLYHSLSFKDMNDPLKSEIYKELVKSEIKIESYVQTVPYTIPLLSSRQPAFKDYLAETTTQKTLEELNAETAEQITNLLLEYKSQEEGIIDPYYRSDPETQMFKCISCNRFFAELFFIKHMKEYHKKVDPLECKICLRLFSKTNDLYNHLIKEHKTRLPYICNNANCSDAFQNFKEYLKHLPNHRMKKSFKCPDCSLQFLKSGELKQHLENIHQKDMDIPKKRCKEYTCPVIECDLIFSDLALFGEHLKSAHAHLLFFCHKFNCNAFFISKEFLEKHMIIHDIFYHCKEKDCRKKFKQLDTFKEHLLIDHNLNAVFCTNPDCTAFFSTTKVLRQHMRLVHKNKNKIYICKEIGCQKTFDTVDAYREHLLTEHKFTLFYCSEPNCQKFFTTKPSLRQHFKLKHMQPCNSNVRAQKNLPSAGHIKCTIETCENIFTNVKDLITHLKKDHSIVNPYKCPEDCSDFFPTITKLKQHIRTIHKKIPVKSNLNQANLIGIKYIMPNHSPVVPQPCQTETNNPTQTSLLQCQVCKELFIGKLRMHNHLRNSHQISPKELVNNYTNYKQTELTPLLGQFL